MDSFWNSTYSIGGLNFLGLTLRPERHNILTCPRCLRIIKKTSNKVLAVIEIR
uniref:Uncharacterized protein n=1 Tax=Arundo donax TaxID=35708 RepID=A0A0A9H598_ARUDO